MRRFHAECLGLAGLLLPAAAIGAVAAGTQIELDLRPIVTLRYSGAVGTPTGTVAVGILDTGDPMGALSKETASLLGMPPVGPLNVHNAFVYPAAGSPNSTRRYNQATVAAQTITSGGWLGSVLQPPERPTADPNYADPQVRAGDPSHVFDLAVTDRSHKRVSTGLYPWYFDYNGAWSENHTGMAFMTNAETSLNHVAFVDPINATPIPFAYDRANGGNGRGLSCPTAINPPDPSLHPAPTAIYNPEDLSLDQLASSVSYFAASDGRVPVFERNANPGFVHWVDLEAREFHSSALSPQKSEVVVDAGLAVPRQLTHIVSAADAAKVDHLAPIDLRFTSDCFLPMDASGNLISPVYSEFKVSSADIACGGETVGAFVRTDGELTIVVERLDGVVVHGPTTVRLPSQAPRPYGELNIPGLVQRTGVHLIDTGAPQTVRQGPGAIIGTDELNKFGQFFDFVRGQLVLIAPSDRRIRQLTANGILFHVDRDSIGLAATAVAHEYAYGTIPQLQINAPALAGDNMPIQAHSTTFRTHLTGSNAVYIDEAATGIPRGTKAVTAQSLGKDRILDPLDTKLFFTVDRGSQGQLFTDVRWQHDLGHSAGDIFEIPFNQARPARVPGDNSQTVNQEVMGLAPNCGPAARNEGPAGDNLTGFDLYTDRALPEKSLSNLDSPITKIGDAGTGSRQRVGDERYGVNFDSYFSMADSPDIFRSELAETFADGYLDIGLAEDDDIDSLALWRPSVRPGAAGSPWIDRGPERSLNLVFNPASELTSFDPNEDALFLGIDEFPCAGLPQTDLALFCLGPDSPSLGALGLSAADVFITDFDGTFTLYASAESLGLYFEDNIDGLDSIPEPGALALLALGLLALIRRRRG